MPSFKILPANIRDYWKYHETQQSSFVAVFGGGVGQKENAVHEDPLYFTSIISMNYFSRVWVAQSLNLIQKIVHLLKLH